MGHRFPGLFWAIIHGTCERELDVRKEGIMMKSMGKYLFHSCNQL